MSVVIYTGRAGHTSQLGSHLVGGAMIAVSAGLLATISIGRGVSVPDNLRPAALIILALLAAGGVFRVLRAVIRVVSVAYRIDDVRVEVERGLLSRKIDNLELWRAKDIRFRQGLLQRFMGTGDVELDTNDVSDRVLVLRGLPGARGIYDRLRDAIDAARRAKGVVAVEADTAFTQ